MLGSITSLGERARGRRWSTTYGWFVAGTLLGGLALGLGLVAIAALGAMLPRPAVVSVSLLGAAAVLGCAVLERTPPSLARQVDHRWLDRYRGWVVGAGFGFQLGAGVFTRILSYALYLIVCCAFAGASPAALIATGLLYGAVRGLSAAPGGWVRGPQHVHRLNEMALSMQTASRSMSRAVDLLAAGAIVAALLLTVA